MKVFSMIISMTSASFINFETCSVMLFKDKKRAKMLQNMKFSNRIRTVFESAVLCKSVSVPYSMPFLFHFDDLGVYKFNQNKPSGA